MKRNSEPLQITGEVFGTIFDTIPFPYLVMENDSQKGWLICMANRSAEKFFRYEAGELNGKSISDLFPEENKQKLIDSIEKIVSASLEESGETTKLRLKGKAKGGEDILVAAIARCIDCDGKGKLVLGLEEDSKKLSAEKKMMLLVEASPSGMLMVDGKGIITLANTQVENLFGYKREELVGEPIEILVPESARGDHPKKRKAFLRNPETRPMGAGRDLFGVHKSGRLIPVEIGLNPVVNNEESFVIASVVDITERKKAESLLEEKIRELEKSNADLQEFAYVCSHDLQEPLRVISNYSKLIARRYTGKLDENADEFIDIITDASLRMQTLINDLLTYSRIQTKGKAFRKIELSEIVKTASENLKLSIEENSATIKTENLPAVYGDSSQLLQLFQNIIGNSIKFRTDAPPLISIKSQEMPDSWKIDIQDNGIGFDMKHADRIFVIFQRLHTRDDYEGSGIGLAICKKIVLRHGGKVSVISSLGEGTLLSISLPKRVPSTEEGS